MKSVIFVSNYQSINLLDVIVSHMNVFNSVVTCYMRSSHSYSIICLCYLWYISLIFLNTVLSFPCIRARLYVHTYIRAYVHTYIRTYVHTYIHTYVHMYIRTYIIHIHTFCLFVCSLFPVNNGVFSATFDYYIPEI